MRALYHRVLGPLLSAWGTPLVARLEDRRVLERVIFPYVLENREFADVLWVGCDWYTARYPSMFEGRNFWTLEIDPAKRRYGSQRHITDSLENVERHFGRDALDLILCNGVFGWGLNAKAAVERAFAGCFVCLRPGGVLVIGWNDLPRYRPFPLSESGSLHRFEPYLFPPLATNEHRTRTAGRHVFSFYRKPATWDGMKRA